MKEINKLKIVEIKNWLNETGKLDDVDRAALENDGRVGVRKLYSQWQKRMEKQGGLLLKYQEMTRFEEKLQMKFIGHIAGIDEVGRGPLAGPVVAAAVILSPERPVLGLDDSKKLSAVKRRQLTQEIKAKAVAYSVGEADPAEIDSLNIYQATKLAMKRAFNSLEVKPSSLLIDAMELPIPLPQVSLVKGDSRSVSIAAASIIAKEHRDLKMNDYDHLYPGYGFSHHKGYGTREHLEQLQKQGPAPIHRKSFAPVSKIMT